MSQTAAAPPPPAPAGAPAPARAPGTWAAPVGAPVGTAVIDTPRLLNRWQLIGMSVAIVFGLVSAMIQFLSWQSDGRAAGDTEQLLRVQEIQSTLLRADALATNAFLKGGLEDTEQRDEYDAAIDSVLGQIAEAAEAQPADKEALAALNVQVSDYIATVSQARDNNRQGFPVGAEYMTGASAQLRAEALPILAALVEANSGRAEDAIGGQHPIYLAIVGLLALAGLWWINREIGRHFRRRVNRGVAVAFLMVLVVSLVTVVAATARDNSNDSLLEGDFRLAINEAAARTAANDAKANESLRLIKRGSGQAFEDAWDVSAAVVDEQASRETAAAWDDYVAQHEQIKDQDEGGDWDAAVAQATDPEAGSTLELDEFDAMSESVAQEAGDTATEELRSGRALALGISALTLLLGIVAAVAVSRGIGERRREFA